MSVLDKLIVCTIWCMIVVASSCSYDNVSSNSSAETVVPGEKIYQKYCVSCHGTDGSMGANGAHNLRISTLSFEEQLLVVKKGRNTMTAFEKVLGANEIEAVVLYINSFKKAE
jgi:cytochrome c6